MAGKFSRPEYHRESVANSNSCKVEVYKGQEPTTMKALKRKLQNTWNNLSQETLESLEHSMPKRIKAVLNQRGGHSGYLVKV